MDRRRNIDSKSYMDLRGYFFYFLRLATSLHSLMFLMDIKRNIDSTSYMDLRRYPPVNLRAGRYRIFSPMFHEALLL